MVNRWTEYPSVISENGDLLVVCKGAGVGKMAENSIGKAHIARQIQAVRNTLHILLPKYVRIVIEYNIQNIIAQANGLIPGLKRETLLALLIPIPPIEEQKRIVDEVVKWFIQIDAIEQDSSDLKDAVQKAKSKILDLALSGRLTSHTSHYRKWPYLPLSEIFNITMGQSPEGYYINQNNDGVEFHQGKLHFGQRHLLNSGVFTSNITKVADACSLLMCVRAPVGVLNITNREVCIGRGLCALKPKDSNMPIEYWYYALSSLSNYFEENSTGSTFKAITMDVIKTTYVYVPPVNEQRLIVRQLEHIYKIIDSILNHLTP